MMLRRQAGRLWAFKCMRGSSIRPLDEVRHEKRQRWLTLAILPRNMESVVCTSVWPPGPLQAQSHVGAGAAAGASIGAICPSAISPSAPRLSPVGCIAAAGADATPPDIARSSAFRALLFYCQPNSGTSSFSSPGHKRHSRKFALAWHPTEQHNLHLCLRTLPKWTPQEQVRCTYLVLFDNAFSKVRASGQAHAFGLQLWRRAVFGGRWTALGRWRPPLSRRRRFLHCKGGCREDQTLF